MSVIKGIKHTMRLNEPTQNKRQEKRARQAHEHGLCELAHRGAVDAVEDQRARDPRQGVQQARGAEHGPRLLGRDVFRQRALQRRAAHAADGGQGAGEDEEVRRAHDGVRDVAEHVEEDGGADDVQVETIAAAFAHGGAVAGPADEAGDGREEHQEVRDAADVDDGDKDLGFKGAPAEGILGVDDHDGHAAHGDAEHDGVDRREGDEIAAHGAVRARACGPEHFEGGEEIVLAECCFCIIGPGNV